jgi:DtxR family transcriptional regulator, Mn-dependent transcriptional regulator
MAQTVKPSNDEISSTLEDYLEAIFRIEKEKRAARVKDISQYLGVAKSTVNAALKSLTAKGLIDYEPYQLITLTQKGRERATEIVIFHEVMRHFLQDILALDEDRAELIACEMEHAVDRDVIERFVCFLAFIENLDDGQKIWMNNFRKVVGEKPQGKVCARIIEKYMETLQPKIDFAWEQPDSRV